MSRAVPPVLAPGPDLASQLLEHEAEAARIRVLLGQGSDLVASVRELRDALLEVRDEIRSLRVESSAE